MAERGRGGLQGEANHDQLGSPCPRGAEEQEAAAHLHLHVVNLTSYCTDTSIIVIKGQSNLFIY